MPNLWHVVKNLATLGLDVIIKTVFVKSIVKIQYIIRNQCVVSESCFFYKDIHKNWYFSSGNDGNTYRSECQLRQYSCRIQKEIVVVKYESCTGTTFVGHCCLLPIIKDKFGFQMLLPICIEVRSMEDNTIYCLMEQAPSPSMV